jgi:hypothetical protein
MNDQNSVDEKWNTFIAAGANLRVYETGLKDANALLDVDHNLTGVVLEIIKHRAARRGSPIISHEPQRQAQEQFDRMFDQVRGNTR